MVGSAAEVTVRHDARRRRFVLLLDGVEVGVATYRVTGDRVVLPHTEVDPALRGRGLAGRLVGHVLDEVRSWGKRVVPSCPYVAAYIERHPRYADLVEKN